MSNEYLVYGLIDPDDFTLRYIGQSSSGIARPKSWLHGKYGKGDASGWIRALEKASKKPGIVVLEKCTDHINVKWCEKKWIAVLRCNNANLLNKTPGGESYQPSIYGLEKKKTNNLPPIGKGKDNPFYGKKHTEATRLAISRINSKAIVDSFGNEYSSIKEASIRLNIDYSSIGKNLRNRPGFSKVKGMTFHYKD
jgi:hypothetical protein